MIRQLTEQLIREANGDPVKLVELTFRQAGALCSEQADAWRRITENDKQNPVDVAATSMCHIAELIAKDREHLTSELTLCHRYYSLQ